MTSVAKIVRKRTLESVRAMSPAERIALAFALGEHDLSLYMEARATDRETAIATLRATRHNGRRRSVLAPNRRA
jgi:hypothetical protein